MEFYLKTVGGSEPELEVSDDDDDDDDIIALPLGKWFMELPACRLSIQPSTWALVWEIKENILLFV